MPAWISSAKITLACVLASLSISVANARTPPAELQKIEGLLQAGDFATAKAAIQRLEQANQADPELKFLKGLTFAQSGDTDSAIRVFYNITQDYPELPEPYNNLAVLYAKKQQYNKARAALRTAISTHPAYSTAHTNLGDIYAILASIAYKRAVDQNATDEQSLVKLRMLTQITSVDPSEVNMAVLAQEPTTDFSPDGSGSRAPRAAQPRRAAATPPVRKPAAVPLTRAPAARAPTARAPAIKNAASQPARLPTGQPQPNVRRPAPTRIASARPATAVKTAQPSRASSNSRAIHVYPSGQKAPPKKAADRFTASDVPVVRDPATHVPQPPRGLGQSDLPRRLKLPKVRSETERRAAVEKHLLGWVGAWSRGQQQTYFKAYGTKMRSSAGQGWQQKRRRELSVGKNRRINMRRPVIEFLSSDLAVVNLELDYRSTGQKYRAQVLVMLENTHSGWKIIREEVLKKNG